MVRRSRLEVYFDILEVIQRGIDKPTRIMYKTNLSWATLQEQLETLIKGGFINEDLRDNAKRYSVTDKGRGALSYYLKSLDGLFEIKKIVR